LLPVALGWPHLQVKVHQECTNKTDINCHLARRRRVSTTLRQVLTEFSEFFICWIGVRFPQEILR
jgi:hypothetical protein